MAATRENAVALSPSLSDASAAQVTGETPKYWVRLGVAMVDHASPSSLNFNPKKNLLEKPFTPQELLGRVKLILRSP